LVFKSSTNARGAMNLLYSGVLISCICFIISCPCWFCLHAILYALGIGDFPPSLVDLVPLFCFLPIFLIIITLLNVAVGPSLSKVTLTFDGRAIGMHYPAGLFSRDKKIHLGDVISIARHRPRDNLSLRRVFGLFNPAKAGVIVKTAGKSYSINTEDFDEFADVIKKYKPEIGISG
jgi:hypothetical protein